MIQALDSRPREFIARLKALSDALASGPEDQGFEARVLKRLSVWQRRRGGVPVVAGRAGLLLAFVRLSDIGGSIPEAGALLEIAGNDALHRLYVSLGSGIVSASGLCVALTVPGLALARLLEEV